MDLIVFGPYNNPMDERSYAINDFNLFADTPFYL